MKKKHRESDRLSREANFVLLKEQICIEIEAEFTKEPSIKQEPTIKEEPSIKEEPICEWDCPVLEASGVGNSVEVKNDLSMMSTTPARPGIHAAANAIGKSLAMRECFVSLERVETLKCDTKTNCAKQEDQDKHSQVDQVNDLSQCETKSDPVKYTFVLKDIADDGRNDVCAICGQRFAERLALLEHAVTHIYVDSLEIEDVTVKDEVPIFQQLGLRDCKVKLDRLADPQTPASPTDATHESSFQRRNLRERALAQAPLNPTHNPLNSKYFCDICGKGFPIPSRVKDHVNVHSRIKRFRCDICGNKFAWHRDLKRHILEIHEGPYSCGICDKRFIDTSSLKRHKRGHADSGMFPCAICGKEYKQSLVLYKHSTIHTGEKPYACSTCGMIFETPYDLSMHRLIHLNDSCGVCKKRFKRPHDLKKHKLVHVRKLYGVSEKEFKKWLLDGRLSNIPVLNM